VVEMRKLQINNYIGYFLVLDDKFLMTKKDFKRTNSEVSPSKEISRKE
jgi:hypothetical protein